VSQQRVGDQTDHVVAAQIAVLVVERFEMVDVAARGPEWLAVGEQAIARDARCTKAYARDPDGNKRCVISRPR